MCIVVNVVVHVRIGVFSFFLKSCLTSNLIFRRTDAEAIRGVVLKTLVRRDSLDPVWHENMTFPFIPSSSDTLHLQVRNFRINQGELERDMSSNRMCCVVHGHMSQIARYVHYVGKIISFWLPMENIRARMNHDCNTSNNTYYKRSKTRIDWIYSKRKHTLTKVTPHHNNTTTNITA